MNNTSGGIGLGWLLTIVFVVLKLTHVIAWSWWLVFLPVFISTGLGLLIVLVALVLAFISKDW